MSSIGSALSDCCNYLESNKKSERRKRIEELKLLLENPLVLEFLTKNSDSDRGLSWIMLFSALHNCLLKEAECYSEEKAKGKILPATDKAVKACCGLLDLLVTAANTGTPRLPCTELLSCIRQVLEIAESDEVVLNSVIGETYINLFGLALSSEKYWGEIVFQTWRALGRLTIAILKKLTSEKMKATTLSILNVILLQGGRLSAIIVKSKFILHMLPEIIKTLIISKYPKVELSCLHISHTICIQYGKEFRLSVCNFIDTILPYIMTLNGSRITDSYFKELISQVLLDMVCIRMLDKSWSQEASSLLDFAEKELGYVSKHKLELPPLPKIVILAVKLAKQVHGVKSENEDYEDPDVKRRKVSSYISSILDNLSLYSSNPSHWLCYLEQLIGCAPEVVLEEDIQPLSRYFADTLRQTSDPVPIRYITKSSVLLLKICKNRNLTFHDKSIEDLQSILWAAVLRFVTTPNLTDTGLALADDLIPLWVSHESVKTLLGYYIDKKIPVTNNALQTLINLSSSGFLGSLDVKISLINWYFTGEKYSADAILCLLLKSKLPLSPQKDHQSEINLTDIEVFNLLMSFGIMPTATQTSVKEEPTSGFIEDKLVCDSYLCQLIEKLSAVNSLDGLLSLCTSLCSLQNSLQTYQLSIYKRHDELLDRTLPSVISRLESSLRSSSRDEALALVSIAGEFFEQLSKLNKVKIADQALCLFNVLLDLLKKQHKNSMGFKCRPTLPGSNIIQDKPVINQENSETCIIDAIFSLLKIFSENEKIQAYINLINFCSCDLNLTTQSGLNITATVIKKIVASKNITLVLIKDIISLELKLCKRWFLYYTGTLQIIDVVDATVEPLFLCDEKSEIKSQIYLIINSFAKQVTSKKYGSHIIVKLVSLLVHAIQKDPQSIYLIDTESGKKSPILYFVDFLRSPFHEVRIRSTEFLPILFGFEMNLEHRRDQSEAFNLVLKTVDELFIVKDGQNPEDIKEEGINRTASALKILLGLICSCYVWRRKSLYHLFKLISSKNISPSLFPKLHSYLEHSLKIDSAISFFEQNLDYILWNWYKDYKSFEKFPYKLMDFKSLDAFLSEYKTIIVPIFLENLDLDSYLSFCEAISMNKTEVAITCFPELIACLLPKLGGADLRPAEKINEFIFQLIEPSTVKSLLASEIRKVLLAIFMKLNDIDHFTSICGSSYLQLPTRLPLNVDFGSVLGSLKHLQRSTPNPQQFLLIFLCNEYPAHIQFLMHNLLANISSATTTENRSLCFLQYITLCDLIASGFENIKRMAGYVVWHAIKALLNLTRTDLSLQSGEYLYKFLNKCLPRLAKFVDYCLDDLFIFVGVTSSEDSETGRVACNIKEFLIANKVHLPRITAYLPMEETTVNLEEEINFFIHRQNPDIFALERLSGQLILRRKELNYLYEEVQNSKCFSDDCSRSLVHQLVSKLVTLTTSSDKNIRIQAAQCLGQIGPRNLNTLALQPESSCVPPPLAEKILLQLLPLLVSNDPELSESASAAVSELLRTDEGFASLDQLKSIEKSLFTPFIPLSSEKIKSIPREFSPGKLVWASGLRVIGGASRGWTVWSGGDHVEWTQYVVSQLLAAFDNGVLPLLSPIALKEVELGEELLPYIIDIIISKSEEFPEGLKIVQNNLAYFFKKHFLLRSNTEQCEDATIYLNRKSVQCMISIMNFIRLKAIELPEEKRTEHLQNLNVSFLYVAYAAQFCRAYFTSLLYAELWVESLKSDLNSASINYNTIPLDLVCKNFPDDGQVLLNILWEDYKELGEQDGIVGCASLQLGDPNARIRYFREMGLWQQLIEEADLGNQKEALSHGLLMSGLFTCASQLSNCGWEAAWRLSRWDIEHPTSGNDEFSGLHYSAIRSAVHQKDKHNALTFLEPARDLVLRGLADASLEVAASVYLPLTKLQLINELESWCNGEDVNTEPPDSEWIHAEPILWQRGLLMEDAELWLSTARIARKNSSHLVALKLLQHMKGFNLRKDLFDEMSAEEAQIHWDSGKLETAKFILKNLLDNVEDPIIKGKCLLTYAAWMSESKSEGPIIIEQYFSEASSLLQNDEAERLAAAECFAKFADSEYQRIHRYLNSPEFEMKKSRMEAFRKNLEYYKNVEPQTLEERKSVKIHQCNIEVDKNEINTIQEEHSTFLGIAVREYLNCLRFEKTQNDKMFRFVSLWLANSKLTGSKSMDIDHLLDSVPSYRFIPVFPQLAVRITSETDQFSRTLKKLLFRCCQEHPFQNVWHLLALANANADSDQPQLDSTPQPRMVGAKKLLQELSRGGPTSLKVLSMQELADAYISLANLQLPKNCRPGDQKIPKPERLRQLRDIPHISCCTITLPVKKNCDYSDVIGIVGFDEIYTLVGGINYPKKVKCLCSDGKKRDELVKGQDDPRQDALMQQVFTVLNSLLESDKNTARRKLNIRTYKVVPLTQKSGVIEWCSNTEPIGNYLKTAHAKHRPNDLSQAKCRANLELIAGESNDKKLQMFLQICSRFKPVMRHFFFEKFPMPGVWYEKRLAYTRSVATNSMIGYLMGIGDRHVFNILIDQATAELIHIDFGISFELGRILPTPENVPFRLTRDIEDGMGITGAEGFFRRCCEETMRVVRKRSEPIMTILEMLLYDPLHSWSIKPRYKKAQQSIPDMSAEETNKLAERFLHRLKLKLAGREEGEASSVEGQVQHLIQEARDPKNLCRLYRGWQAYL